MALECYGHACGDAGDDDEEVRQIVKQVPGIGEGDEECGGEGETGAGVACIVVAVFALPGAAGIPEIGIGQQGKYGTGEVMGDFVAHGFGGACEGCCGYGKGQRYDGVCVHNINGWLKVFEMVVHVFAGFLFDHFFEE